MNYYILKLLITAVIIVIVSEISKRSTFVGALLASIPIVSVLAMIWLYIDTKSIEKISDLSIGIFWLVLPSLALFILLPILLKNGVNFYLSMLLSIFFTAGCYSLMIFILGFFNIKI